MQSTKKYSKEIFDLLEIFETLIRAECFSSFVYFVPYTLVIVMLVSQSLLSISLICETFCGCRYLKRISKVTHHGKKRFISLGYFSHLVYVAYLFLAIYNIVTNISRGHLYMNNTWLTSTLYSLLR